MDILYVTSATAAGRGRSTVRSDNGLIDFEIRAPKELGGPGGSYTNPEQLFAAGFAACFNGALSFVSLSRKLRIDLSVTANVSTGRNDEGGLQFAVALSVNLPGIDRQTADELVAAAERICPYSNATRDRVALTITVNTFPAGKE